jgi:transporter family protein
MNPSQFHAAKAILCRPAQMARNVGASNRAGEPPPTDVRFAASVEKLKFSYRRTSDTKIMNWIGWALLSAVFAAATAILAKIGVTGVDSNFATAIRTSVVVVFTWLIALAARQPGTFSLPSGRTLLFLALSGLATGLSWLCYFHALQIGPATRVAPVDKLSVPLVIVLGTLFLGENLTWGKGIGALLICAGAIAVTLD